MASLTSLQGYCKMSSRERLPANQRFAMTASAQRYNARSQNPEASSFLIAASSVALTGAFL
jgi:hypothetical protein